MEVKEMIQCMKCGNVVLYTSQEVIETHNKRVEKAVLEEREECAKIVQDKAKFHFSMMEGQGLPDFLIEEGKWCALEDAAKAIRARGLNGETCENFAKLLG